MYGFFLTQFWTEYSQEKLVIKEKVAAMNEYFDSRHPEDASVIHSQVTEVISTLGIMQKLKHFESKRHSMPVFILNYMKQFEAILRHIRASRHGDWLLHLVAQDELNKFFFAHDHLNYARLSPVYCTKMTKLESENPKIWEALKSGDFYVHRSDIRYCSVGTDHGIEH